MHPDWGHIYVQADSKHSLQGMPPVYMPKGGGAHQAVTHNTVVWWQAPSPPHLANIITSPWSTSHRDVRSTNSIGRLP